MTGVIVFIIGILAFILVGCLITTDQTKTHLQSNQREIKICKEQRGQLLYVSKTDTYDCLLPKL